MRKIGSKILIGGFAVLYIGFFLVTGISDLTNKEDVHSVNVDMAYEALEVEHSINGLIPVGKDHYYIGLDTDTMEYYVIHASKKWLGENFDDSAQSLQAGGLNITALSKELDYKIAGEMSSVSQRLGDAVFPYGASNCLEVSYKSDEIGYAGADYSCCVGGLLLFKTSGKGHRRKNSGGCVGCSMHSQSYGFDIIKII